LLPTDWITWESGDVRAVLAHELIHVIQADYLFWIMARLGTALHFYHLLVHWLGSRLQIHQELAADALAAPFAGGRTLYLQALARMALRQADRPSGWPARTFLSGPGTLMRRIRMLRGMQNVSAPPRPGWARLIVALILATVAVGVSALRSPAQKADSTSGE